MDTSAQDAAMRAREDHPTIVEYRYYERPNIAQLTRFDNQVMHLSSERYGGDRVTVAWSTQAYDGRPLDQGTIYAPADDLTAVAEQIAEWAGEETPQEIF